MPADILVVANPYEAERLRRALVAAGHPTTCADGSAGMLARWASLAPRVVVIAQPLARGDAGALIRELRRQDGGAAAPVVLIGTDGSARPEEAQACLSRPIDFQLLARTVDELASAAAAEAAVPVAEVSTPPLAAPAPPPAAATPRPVATPPPAAATPPTAPPSVAEPPPAPPPPPAAATPPPVAATPTPAVSTSTPVPQAAELPDRGRLADSDLATLLGRLYRQGFTGRLAVRQGDAEKSVFFDGGFPVYVTSNLPSDHMSEQLFREGRLTREQYEDCKSIVAETGRRTGAILVDRGFLKESELLDEVRGHYENILYSAFGWEEGDYEIAAEGPPVERVRLSAHPAALVVEGLRRRGDGPRLAERLGGMRATLRPTGRDDLLRDAALTEDEKRAALLMDGRRSLGDVVRRSGLPEGDVSRLAWALLVLGVVRQPTAVVAVRSPEWELAPDSAEIDAARVAARHGLVREGDYFEVLGVSRDATRVEVERAHERARAHFAPGMLQSEVASRMLTEIEEIALILDEALRILQDDDRRDAYRRALE